MSKIILSILLAGLFYVVLLVCFKIMGKREVNQLSTVDIVINILIANVAAGGIVEEEYWLDALGGVLVLVMLQILMAKFQIKYPRGRQRSVSCVWFSQTQRRIHSPNSAGRQYLCRHHHGIWNGLCYLRSRLGILQPKRLGSGALQRAFRR